MFKEWQAMAVCKSFSSVKQKDFLGKPDFPGGSRLESPESGLAVNIK